jgi:hypothetical protein
MHEYRTMDGFLLGLTKQHMNAEFKHLPAILLISGQASCLPAREWLRDSRFRTWEAMNVFDALEGISDFTLRSRPDVILLSVESVIDDFQLLSGLLLHSEMDELEFPIFALSERKPGIKDRNVFEGDLAEIKAKLEEIVPKTLAAAPH